MAKIMIGKYEATIYPEGNGYTGAIDIGTDGTGRRLRIKRKGKTKAIVKDKLKQFVDDREKGIKTDKHTENYTIKNAVTDWLTKGTKNLGSGTVDGYRILADKHLIPEIGAIRLKALSADDVYKWLGGLRAKLSTRSLVMVHSILRRAIRQTTGT